MDAVWEAVYVCTLGSDIVDSNLWVWHTTAEPALWVRLVLDLTIAPRRTCNKLVSEHQGHPDLRHLKQKLCDVSRRPILLLFAVSFCVVLMGSAAQTCSGSQTASCSNDQGAARLTFWDYLIKSKLHVHVYRCVHEVMQPEGEAVRY